MYYYMHTVLQRPSIFTNNTEQYNGSMYYNTNSRKRSKDISEGKIPYMMLYFYSICKYVRFIQRTAQVFGWVRVKTHTDALFFFSLFFRWWNGSSNKDKYGDRGVAINWYRYIKDLSVLFAKLVLTSPQGHEDLRQDFGNRCTTRACRKPPCQVSTPF